ncbi:undecaprenyl/decaprenyl-phosphate alpha-N-acetylglucosaminyl 1-phosphate transferase [Alphaproteobacteria bacterium]|nr:undecaprenyl/decaprenyl-phosphate alpha-N-acetylglucosaminyl 1-phosphate transferase [Alphaproteobacteria bacterium]
MINFHYLIFVILLNIFIILIMPFFAFQFKLIDSISQKNNQQKEAYLIGGIAIFVTTVFFGFIFKYDPNINFLILISSIVVLTGIIDDAIKLSVLFRFFIQSICASIIIGSGMLINDFGFYIINNLVDITSLSILLTLVSIIGLTNAINFIDGIDGLASGIILIGLMSIFSFAVAEDNIVDLTSLHKFNYFNIAYVLFFSVLTFFIFNVFIKQKIFLGDAGSTFLGFFFGWLLIYYSQEPLKLFHPVLCVWCVTVPVYDLLSVILKRISENKNPFKPDKNHLHHLLQLNNIDNRMILTIILSFGVSMSIIGFVVYQFFGPIYSLIIYLLLFIPYFIITAYLKNNTSTISE